MSVLFEMRICVGGDPRGFNEFMALRDELAKLGHPACPDVDWAVVEQLCLTLFRKNGAELHSVAAFALARSHRHGLDGMTQGVALIEALISEWPRLWPSEASIRLEILAWLFAELQPLLRGVEINGLPAFDRLNGELERLAKALDRQAQAAPIALQALRLQVDTLMQRLQRNVASGEVRLQSLRMPEPTVVMPVVILPDSRMPEALTPPLKEKKRSISPWLFAMTATIVLAGGFGWKYWQAMHKSEHLLPAPVHLDSLQLFDAGSADLKQGSTKALIRTLAGIKNRPGWLIVIAGHTDATGEIEQNLKLASARASAVREWLQRMGDIPDSCFAVQGVAASQPIDSNDTEAGRANNRRVDIRLVPEEIACG
ncbi:type VI secretion system peptidoglycan-associated domain protein [compost metagenome]